MINKLISLLNLVRYTLIGRKEQVDVMKNINNVQFDVKPINSNKDMIALIDLLEMNKVYGLNSNPEVLFIDGKAAFTGKALEVVKTLLYAKERSKSFNDGSWEDKERILKFLGIIERNMEVNEAFINEQYTMHKEIYGVLHKVDKVETAFPYVNKDINRGKTLLQILLTEFSNENPKLMGFYESEHKSLFAKVNITLRRKGLTASEIKDRYIYIPAEQFGVIRISGNTLVKKVYSSLSGTYTPLKELLLRSIKSTQQIYSLYELPQDYYSLRLQNTVYSILYNNQQISYNKYSAYSLVGVRFEDLNPFNIRVELHKVYQPESVNDIQIDEFDKQFKLKNGFIKYPLFEMSNAFLKKFAPDYVTTRADNKAMYFDNDKTPLSHYTIGEDNASLIDNGSRLAMGTNMITAAMPLRINGNPIPFDNRLVRPKEMPKEFGKKTTDLGYYFWTVDMFFEDSSGNIAHEGARLISKTLKHIINVGDKLDTGMGDKGVINFLDDPLYFYHDNKRIDLSVFVQHDTIGRNNLASTLSGYKDAKIKLDGENIKEVFTKRNGKEVSLGLQAISYTYFYHTDKARGSLSPYGDINDMPVYEEKTKLDKVRIGQDMLIKLAQLGMNNVINEAFSNQLEYTLEEVQALIKDDDKNKTENLYGKYGKATRILQPLIRGLHATTLPNRFIQPDEMIIVASTDHAEIIMRDLKYKGDTHINYPFKIASGMGSRHPMIRKSNMMYTNLYLKIIDNEEGYAYPYLLVNPFTHSLMDGDFDGDESFFYRYKSKEALKELKAILHPKQYDFEKIGHYRNYHRSWTTFEDYIKYLEHIKGKCVSANFFETKSKRDTLIDSAPMHLTTMLSKELIGRAKGPIMRFESQMTAYLSNNDLLDKFGPKLQATVQKLNETYTQPTISMQKWTDNLASALKLAIKLDHLGRYLSIISDGLVTNHKSHYFINSYLFNEMTIAKTIEEFKSAMHKSIPFKLDSYKKLMKLFNYNPLNYIEQDSETELFSLGNKHKRKVDNPESYIVLVLDYINGSSMFGSISEDLDSLIDNYDIKEDFFQAYKKFTEEGNQ